MGTLHLQQNAPTPHPRASPNPKLTPSKCKAHRSHQKHFKKKPPRPHQWPCPRTQATVMPAIGMRRFLGAGIPISWTKVNGSTAHLIGAKRLFTQYDGCGARRRERRVCPAARLIDAAAGGSNHWRRNRRRGRWCDGRRGLRPLVGFGNHASIDSCC